MFQSKGKKRNCKKDTSPGISIPDWNIHEEEEVFIDYMLKLSSKHWSFICPWIWENRVKERLEQFVNAIVNGNVIVSLQVCIYRFDISDGAITHSYLCQVYID